MRRVIASALLMLIIIPGFISAQDSDEGKKKVKEISFIKFLWKQNRVRITYPIFFLIFNLNCKIYKI
jgi:hypothetical protein